MTPPDEKGAERPDAPDAAETIAREKAVPGRAQAEADRGGRERRSAAGETASPRARSRDPLVLAIFTAAAAAVGNLAVTYVNGANQTHMEQLKAEQALVLEAIRTGGDVDKASENLRFLVGAGLLQRNAEPLRAYLDKQKPGSGPVLPASGAGEWRTWQSGPDIRALQRCMQSLGVRLPDDGIAGPQTLASIAELQQRLGLEGTGRTDPETTAAIMAACEE